MTKILVIADEPDMCGPIRDLLVHEHHLVEIASDWRHVEERAHGEDFDALILDISSAAIDAAQICRNFRGDGGIAPILILSADSSVSERVNMLDAGADDFLSKPFHLQELAAHVRAILRRPAVLYGKVLVIGDIALDAVACTVLRQGINVHLHPVEFNLLEFFMRHPDQVFTAQALWERVWKSNTYALAGTVRTHMKTLRQKLGEVGPESVFATIRGKGYKMNSHGIV